MLFTRNPQFFVGQVIRMVAKKRESVSQRRICRVYSLPSVQETRSVAQVREPVSQLHPGRVLFEGSLWRAYCLSDYVFRIGETVQVLYRQGNTLMVGHLANR